MPLELEALVGHLYVVGGRSIRMTPPGSLVEVAPRKAARGRELDTFFVLVLPSGDVKAPTTFYERMASALAEQYFSQSGSVTAALRNAFNVVNQNLYDHNIANQNHYEASVVAAVLHDDDVYLARVGTAVAMLLHENAMQTYPEDLTATDDLLRAPMGIQPVPDVRMNRYSIKQGTRLILGDHNVAAFDTGRVHAALSTHDINEALVVLHELALLNATLMLVEFVSPDAEIKLPVHEGESSKDILEQAKSSAKSGGKGGGESGKRRNRRSNPVTIQVKRGLGNGALGLAKVLRTFSLIFDHFFPQETDAEGNTRRRWFASPTATITAIVIPLIVVLLVGGLWLLGTGESEFELCVKEATGAGNIARSIDSNNRTSLLAAWTRVLDIVETCNAMRPNDPTLAALRAEGQFVIDGLNQITRRDAIPLAPIQAATLTRVILQGNNLFMLDDQNNWVYHTQLNPDGRALGTVVQPVTAMSGQGIDQLQLGDIIDIGFDQEERKIVAVDSDGVVIRCSPRLLLDCDAQQLLLPATWGTPSRIAFYLGNLYVLDQATSQIWRFTPTAGRYASQPTPYFIEIQPDLSTAVDIAIDGDGAVYVLFADGTLSKYLSGEPQTFGFAAFPEGLELNNAYSMYLDNNPVSRTIYIVDQSSRSIYETTFSGNFIALYRASDESRFTLLSHIAADPGQGLIYAVSGNALLLFDVGTP